jgi:hypothetical protein
MKQMLLLAGVGLLLSGCASPNLNPPQARAHTGYVDFYAESASELNWDVARFEAGAQSYKTVFSELKAPPGGVLRLAFSPGHYRLRVTFLNRVVREPALVEVEVKDGMVTPVRVVLIADGATQIQTKEEQRGKTFNGRTGRSTKFGSEESTAYMISAEASAPKPYQVKDLTPYAR